MDNEISPDRLSLYISPNDSPNLSEFYEEAKKRNMPISKFAYVSMKHELHKKKLSRLADRISFVLLGFVILIFFLLLWIVLT